MDSDDGYRSVETAVKTRMIAMELATSASLFLGSHDLVSMIRSDEFHLIWVIDLDNMDKN
jgi:hypothetical protein